MTVSTHPSQDVDRAGMSSHSGDVTSPDAVLPPVSQRRGYFSHHTDREIWIAEARTRLLIRDSKGEKLALDRAFAATMAMLAIENGDKQ